MATTVRPLGVPPGHAASPHHTDRFRNLTPEGKRDDPWSCYYGQPSNHFNDDGEYNHSGRCICGYCRDGIDCCPIFSKHSVMERRPCGHDTESPACACIKTRKEPISDKMIERLLMTEREDPDFDYIDGVPS